MTSSILNIRQPDGSVVKFECHGTLPSAANLARYYAKEGYPDRYAVFADKKTDDGASGIYLSLILRPSFFPSQATLLGALSAVAAVTALEEHTEKPVGIGWVSSIYCNKRLIGDISIEGKLDNHTSYEYVIINFEIELNEKDFPARLTDLIKKVFEKDNNSIAMIIAKDILTKFFLLYSNLKSGSKFMDTYHEKFILRGKRVRFSCPDGKRRTYKILGLNKKDCSLVCEDSRGEFASVKSPRSIILPKKV